MVSRDQLGNLPILAAIFSSGLKPNSDAPARKASATEAAIIRSRRYFRDVSLTEICCIILAGARAYLASFPPRPTPVLCLPRNALLE